MLVTKRMPASGEGFVAQRVFRLGAYSFGLAVWFALLEKYSESPPLLSEEVSAYLHTRVSGRTDLKQVYLWMIKPRCFSERAKLSVWNCTEGLDLLRTMLEGVLGASAANLNYGTPQIVALCEALHVTLRDTHSKEPLMGKLTLCLRNTAEGVVLLYESYAREDFYALDCGCLYLKSALHYQLYQIAGNRVISSQECENSFLHCEHQIPLGAKLYQLAVSEAQEGSGETGPSVLLNMKQSLWNSLVENEASSCSICHQVAAELKSFCSKGCKLCENCWIVHYYSEGFSWCPKCTKPLTQRKLVEIQKRLSSYPHLPQIPFRGTFQAFLHCVICNSENTIANGLIHTKMNDSCCVCDKCWRREIVEKGKVACPQCSMSLTSNELERIKGLLQPREEERKELPRAPVPFYKSVCLCPFQASMLQHCSHLSSTAMAWVVNGHAYCIDCLPRDLHCPKCCRYADLLCMGCNTPISFDPNRQGGTVEGLCKAGCVLCICCIYKRRLLPQFKCGVCRNGCRAQHPNDFKNRRKGVKIRCCAEKKSRRLIVHTCGAYVHPDCTQCHQCHPLIAKSAPSTSNIRPKLA